MLFWLCANTKQLMRKKKLQKKYVGKLRFYRFEMRKMNKKNWWIFGQFLSAIAIVPMLACFSGFRFCDYESSPSSEMSGTIWSVDERVKSRFSSAFIHGCSRMSSDKMRSSGSLRSNDRIMQRAFDVKQSGTRNWPRDIFANSDACSESLNGYLQTKVRKRREKHEIIVS